MITIRDDNGEMKIQGHKSVYGGIDLHVLGVALHVEQHKQGKDKDTSFLCYKINNDTLQTGVFFGMEGKIHVVAE